ncbi:MAG: hypothetical protein OXU63_14875 [Acidobacteriota bacterium]|nr:hypothetical protein [Acidobacteriota bacterium]
MKRKLMTRVDGETSLRGVLEGVDPSFASRWRGKLKEARRDDVRYRMLALKYFDGAGDRRSTEAAE